ncbi:MAG: hypothetical protein IT288_18275 [Bdellovibrionales bacterium]|nr:hypothetical protein [Bdellovibrionales bacterium]
MRRFNIKKLKIALLILIPIVVVAWALDRVFLFNIMVRNRLDPQSFYRPHEPKLFIFGNLQSGISFEEFKGFYSSDDIKIHDDPLPGMNFRDVTIEACSHLKVRGKCEFTFLNDRLSKVVFIPVDEVAYERAARLLFGVKEIKRGDNYYLNEHVALSKTIAPANKSYFWQDMRYRDEEFYFID